MKQEALAAQRRQEWADVAAVQLRDHFGPGAAGSCRRRCAAVHISLADPGHRGQAGISVVGAPAETVPPLGVISVAVHARGRTVDEVAAEVGQALEIQESTA